jgi:hypothetical protein
MVGRSWSRSNALGYAIPKLSFRMKGPMDEIVDICSHCKEPIYWGPATGPLYPNDTVFWKHRHWRHKKTQLGVCNWELPIKNAWPTTNRTPPVGAEISESLKRDLKRVFPDEFPEY